MLAEMLALGLFKKKQYHYKKLITVFQNKFQFDYYACMIFFNQSLKFLFPI